MTSNGILRIERAYHPIKKLLSGSSIPSATHLIDSLILFSCDMQASDLHLDPMENGISVRLRIDGSLRDCKPLPRSIHEGLIARLKVLANLRTDEHFVPQDGRFRYDGKDGQVDMRLSIVPTYYGENAVLRFLTFTNDSSSLIDLGLSYKQEAQLIEVLSRTHGMLLVTGPTGSGKTTTLYSLMRLVLERPISLVTVEDPIEYSLRRAVQIPAHRGCSFADGLRSILRQDPDVIMVGEIRDAETAGLAVNAALTGHLVLSTLHTNDAPSTLPRLLDLKVEPYLVASTVSAVMTQRLVRKVCTTCAVEETLTRIERESLSSIFSGSLPQWISRGLGCDMCDGSGYRGRTSISEFMPIDDEMREAILSRASSQELRKIALANGMVPLMLHGLEKVATGQTTVEEILRLRYA